MDYLKKNWTYVLLVGTLFVINTQLFNDVTWIWSGPETILVEQAQGGEAAGLPIDVARLSGAAAGLSSWGLRFPGLVLVSLAGLVLGWIGKKLFGWNLMLTTLLVWFGNLGLCTLTKLASGDIWLFTAQVTSILGMLAYLKKPSSSYRILVYGAIFLSVWLDPLSSLVLVLVISLGLTFLHPRGRLFMALHPWAALGLALLAIGAAGRLDWTPDFFYLGWGRMSFGRFAGWTVWSQLPLLGFLGAGLWDSIRKAGKKEEWAIVQLVVFIGALLAQSPAVLLPISLWVGRHLNDYFLKAYPHANVVKTIQLLHLVGFFFLATLLMLGGFWQFRGTGFRAGMALSATYWMLSLVGVIGLYGYNRRFVLGGTILSGVLATSLFWLQVSPIWESQRTVRQVVSSAGDIGTNRVEVLLDTALTADGHALPLYLAKAGKKVVTNLEEAEFIPEWIVGTPEFKWHREQRDTLKTLSDQLVQRRVVISYGSKK